MIYSIMLMKKFQVIFKLMIKLKINKVRFIFIIIIRFPYKELVAKTLNF
jgi:hypothetical protein